MNKHGFTLIEIIIVIALISIIGVGSVVGVKTIQKNKSELTEITNRIIESASVYIENEKDTNGNYYINGINEGGQGLILPLDTLYDEGYIKENDYNYVIKKISNEKRYVVIGYKTEDECKTGGITIDVNWNDKEVVTTPLYLCSYTKQSEGKETSVIEMSGLVELSKTAVSKEFLTSQTGDITNLTDKSGIFLLQNHDSSKEYQYYRGAVNNNYVKFGRNNNNSDLYWRILWIEKDLKGPTRMKLVLDDTIELKDIVTKDGTETYDIKNESTIYNFDIGEAGDNIVMLNPKVETTHERKETESKSSKEIEEINWEKYTFNSKYSNKDFDYNDFAYYINVENGSVNQIKDSSNSIVYKSNGIYKESLDNWINSTNIISDENNKKILLQNHCFNSTMKIYADDILSSDDKYLGNTVSNSYSNSETSPKNDFSCTGTKGNVSDYVGHLTYGDVVRAGISTTHDNLNKSGNYLFTGADEKDSFILGDLNYVINEDTIISKKATYINHKYQSYVVTKSGISSDVIYLQEREHNFNHSYIYTEGRTKDKYRYYFDYITLNGITYPQQRGYSSEHVKGKTFKNVTNGVIKEKFKAYNIKPTIIIDMTKATLDKNFKDGTKNSSYEIIIN